MQITGKTMIFKNEYGYSTTINVKNEDGTYKHMYVPVGFKKGISLENKTNIDITNGFLTFYTSKNGEDRLKIMVMEFKQEGTAVEELAEDELPF